MSERINIECPVDFVTVNETQVRVTAFLVLLIAVAGFLLNNALVFVLLAADFSLRAFNLAKYSPLALLASRIVKLLSLPVKPIDQAPKRFAAKIGLGFAAAIAVLYFTGLTTAAIVMAGVLVFFALLESVFGFCAGCHAYTIYRKLFLKKA